MSPSAVRPALLRGATALVAVLALSAVPTVPSAAAATAAGPGVHGYVVCPAPWRGQGCGFQAVVPEGSWIFQFRYRDNNGKIRSEIDSGTCTRATCPALTFAVPRIDRIPLGYDTYTNAPLVPPPRTFVRF